MCKGLPGICIPDHKLGEEKHGLLFSLFSFCGAISGIKLFPPFPRKLAK